MQAALHHDISTRLLRDYQFKPRGQWLREGKCPDCSKKELFTHADHPWVLKCGRESKCGWIGHVKDLYPEAFNSWSERFVANDTDPNAAATAYLQMARGLNTAALGDCYMQGQYYDSKLQIGTATVRFPLPCGGYWERLIDRPERFGKRKALFNYGCDYNGTWWVPPHLNLTECDELWLVEGIFDALALRQNDVAAVSVLTCNNYPEKALADLEQQLGRKVPLVWALDSDPAGRKYTVKWVRQARAAGWQCRAAQIPQTEKTKIDWNDLHLREKLGYHDLEKYRYHGALLIAETAAEKALLMFERLNRHEFCFSFNNRMYWYRFDDAKYNKARQEIVEAAEERGEHLSEDEIRDKALERCGGIQQIATCSPHALYFQQNKVTDESWYYFRIDFPDRPSTKVTFTASQIVTAPEFKKRLMHVAAGAHFSGTTQQLDRFILDETQRIKVVDTIDYIGYSKEHGCWIFDKLAVKDGRWTELNEEDFFDFGKLNIKSLISSIGLRINHNSDEYTNDWLKVLWTVYRARGMVALVFWFGSLFAEQIRASHESFPFLEMVGEAGAGKTTLVKFLWKLMGRAGYEGFDPSKASNAGRARNFAQVSGLPVVLMEGDRDEDKSKQKKFDWEELKSVFNGNPIRSLGVKTAGNETYEPPFRGAIVIEQNAPVNASDAILSRIVHMHFDKKGHTEQLNQMAKKLENWPMEKLSHFILAATTKEREILAMLEQKLPIYSKQLQQEPQIREFRIIKNHATLMALLDALALVVPISDEIRLEVQAALTGMAIERQQSINADHPIVQEFWEAYDYLNGTRDNPRINHTGEEGLIAINLNHFYEVAEGHRQKLPPISDIKRHLKSSRTRKFIDQRVVNSQVIRDAGGTIGRSMRCWIFKIEGSNAK